MGPAEAEASAWVEGWKPPGTKRLHRLRNCRMRRWLRLPNQPPVKVGFKIPQLALYHQPFKPANNYPIVNYVTMMVCRRARPCLNHCSLPKTVPSQKKRG